MSGWFQPDDNSASERSTVDFRFDPGRRVGPSLSEPKAGSGRGRGRTHTHTNQENAMMLDRGIRPMRAKDTVHETAHRPKFCHDSETKGGGASSERGFPLLADTGVPGIDPTSTLILSERCRPAGRMKVRRRRPGHGHTRHGRQTSFGRESVATAKCGRGPALRSRTGFPRDPLSS